jgi:iron complex outermembrane receptor protein
MKLTKRRSLFLRNYLLAGVAINAGWILAAQAQAQAQSATSSLNVEEVVVTAGRQSQGGGLIVAQQAPKAVSTVTADYIRDQPAASNPFQLLNQVPNVNANGRDPTGLGRGQISVRGFQSNQIGLSLDGVPINDSGTFNTFPQEYVDTENLSAITLQQGAGDVDSPNIGATGGVLTMSVQRPASTPGLRFEQSFGDNGFRRSFVRLDSGSLGADTRAFVSFSDSYVHEWRGIGQITRDHIDGMVEHDLDAKSRLSLFVAFNTEDMGQYEALTKAQIQQYGVGFNYASTFSPVPTPVAGTAQSASAGDSGLITRANNNRLAYNPFNNLVVSTKANLELTPQIRLDVQPYFWYGFGNASVGSYVAESNTALFGAPRDLNGDGDTLDSALYDNPFVQEQFRPGVIGRLKWTAGIHELVVGFQYEHADLHEWRSLIAVDPITGSVSDIWAKPSSEHLLNSAGQPIRNQDQTTITQTYRPFVGDTIHLLGETLIVTAGVQFPFVDRTGTNRLPLALRTANGQIAPTNPVLNQSGTMPTLGAVYHLNSENQVFLSGSQTFRATDNAPMYQPGERLSEIQPESAVDIEGGYRYQGHLGTASITVYSIHYANREQTLFDTTANNSISKNIGSVAIRGVEMEAGTRPYYGLSAYGSVSFNTSQLLDNLLVGNAFLPTKGKQLTDLPSSIASAELRYDNHSVFGSLDVKYTGQRFSTLTNDERVGDNTVVNLNLGYRVPAAWTLGKKLTVEASIQNLLNRIYLGAINFSNNAIATNGIAGSAPSYYPGPPRFFSIKLRAEF